MKSILSGYLTLFLILILGVLLLCLNITKPFIGHHDFNSVFFSQIARNLVSVNVTKSKLGLVLGYGELDQNHLHYYIDNVPLHPWLLAIIFRLFGQGEFQARALSAVFSLGSLFFIFKLTEKLYSKGVATVASLFFLLSPMFIYFGSSVFPEPQAIFFSLGCFYFFTLWILRKRDRDYYLALLLSSLSLLTVWGTYFLTPFLVLYYLLFEKKKDYKKIAIFAILPFIIFGLFLLHLYVLEGRSFIASLIPAFTSRLNTPQNSSNSFSTKALLQVELHRFLAYYSKTTVVLSLGWLTLLLSKVIKRKLAKNNFLILALFLWGLTYPLVFRQAAYIHDYFLIYLAPFVAISAAVLIFKIASFARNYQPALKMVLIILLFSFPLFQFWQTYNFTSALLATNANLDGYKLGKLIALRTAPQDTTLVLSGQFGGFFGVFTSYYADKNIAYQDFDLSNFQTLQIGKKYDYIVYVEGRDTPQSVKDYLVSTYPYTKNGKFSVFKMKQ